MSINLDPKEIHDKLVSVGTEWTRLNQIAQLLEENQRTEISNLVCDHLNKGKSATEANIRGRAETALVEYNIRMTEARRASNEARVRYDAAKAWFEALRTKASTMRQEMILAGSHK